MCRHSCADTCLMMWCYTYICRHAWSVSTEVPYIHCDTHTYVRRHTHSYTTPAYNYAFLLFYISIFIAISLSMQLLFLDVCMLGKEIGFSVISCSGFCSEWQHCIQCFNWRGLRVDATERYS